MNILYSILFTGIIMLILFSVGCIENDSEPAIQTESQGPAITSTILATTTPNSPIPTSPSSKLSSPLLIFDISRVRVDYASNGVSKSFSLNFSNTGRSGNVEIRVWNEDSSRIYSDLTKTFYVLDGGKYNITVYTKPSVQTVSKYWVYINSTNSEKRINVLSPEARMNSGKLDDVHWFDIIDIEISPLNAP